MVTKMIVFSMMAAVTTIVFMMYAAPFLLKLLRIDETDRAKAKILTRVIKTV